MSAIEFFLDKGYTPVFRHVSTAGAGTVTVWTPTTSTRLVLTNLTVASNLGGTVLFTLGNLAGTKVFEFNVGGSSTVSPTIGAIESTMYDRSLFAAVSGGGTEGFKITAVGFELP